MVDNAADPPDGGEPPDHEGDESARGGSAAGRGGDPADHDEMASLTGAYALNAVPAQERDRFEAHLETCAECRREVRGFLEATAVLAEGVAVDPPPELRERVMAAVSTTAQVAATGRPSAPPGPPIPLRGRRTWPTWIAPAVAAACLVVAVVLGGVAIQARQRLSREQARNRALAAALADQQARERTVNTILASDQVKTRKVTAVLAAVDARRLTGTVASGGRGVVVVSRSSGAAVVVASGVAALPSTRTYQLWLIGASGARSAGLLTGTGVPVLVTGVGAAGTLAMTVEPAGGTPQPTTTPIMAITLPRS